MKRGSKSSGSRGTDSQKASSNTPSVVVQARDHELVEVLNQLDLVGDTNVIAQLEDEQRIMLKALISKYRNLLKLKRKYSNVENIDNESKSDYNDEADDTNQDDNVEKDGESTPSENLTESGSDSLSDLEEPKKQFSLRHAQK